MKMNSTQTIIDSKFNDNTTDRRLPPLVLPIMSESPEENTKRIKTFIANCNRHKFDKTNINSNTKKYLARTGFHLMAWSAILIDPPIFKILKNFFGDNMSQITNEQFEATFGISFEPNADISEHQLILNALLFFTVWAKSDTDLKHGQLWPLKRIQALYRMCGMYGSLQELDSNVDSHPELFVETRRRFRVYKDLIPTLTRYIIDSVNRDDNDTFKNALLVQIKLILNYSGLETFKRSWDYCRSVRNDKPYFEAFELEAVKENINRLMANHKIIVDKYGEDMLPFARLMGYPEAEGLDHKHYPDLAFCAHHLGDNISKNALKQFSFRNMKTKTHKSELRRLADKSNENTSKIIMEEFGFESYKTNDGSIKFRPKIISD